MASIPKADSCSDKMSAKLGEPRTQRVYYTRLTQLDALFRGFIPSPTFRNHVLHLFLSAKGLMKRII